LKWVKVLHIGKSEELFSVSVFVFIFYNQFVTLNLVLNLPAGRQVQGDKDG